MNRLLVLVVLILIPITVVTKKEDAPVMKVETLEKKEFEISNIADILDEEQESNTQVLISQNNDKSNSYSMDLEEYIVGVVAGEMPASFHMEALKAQAVAARSYAMYKMKNIKGYVLSTSTNDQVYINEDVRKKRWGKDFDYYEARVREAVESTKGEVLTYQNDIIIAYYFAISNGYTDDGKTVFKDDKAYLVSVDSSWDRNFSSYSSSFNMNKNEFCNRLGISCNDIKISEPKRSESHYVREVTINNKTFSGIEVFQKLNLKSADFDLTVNTNSVTIKTRGFGHGVGLSQYGAQAMASAGKSYENILTHYYKDTNIHKI